MSVTQSMQAWALRSLRLLCTHWMLELVLPPLSTGTISGALYIQYMRASSCACLLIYTMSMAVIGVWLWQWPLWQNLCHNKEHARQYKLCRLQWMLSCFQELSRYWRGVYILPVASTEDMSFSLSNKTQAQGLMKAADSFHQLWAQQAMLAIGLPRWVRKSFHLCQKSPLTCLLL